MIPAALTAMLQQGVSDFLRMSFWSSTPGMETVIERFLATDGSIFKGPFISARLPFRSGADTEFFPEIPLGYPAHLHQEHAWERLTTKPPKSTLVATGTGSGKTEAFLVPILDYCRRNLGTSGVKAILIYPMNALATDQARRIADLCSSIPSLAGVRAGLYIGESEDRTNAPKAHTAMGVDHIITDRGRMQRDPPDILLTNYKMLDYLLVRPADQELWAPSSTTPVRFLVVDELHSFDGAQGTDLACLIRRLKARLGTKRGELCCIGTSATLGGRGSGAELRQYAENVFGEPFDRESVVGETRQGPEEFFRGHLIEHFLVPAQLERLDPSRFKTPDEYVVTQQELWFDEPLSAPFGTSEWDVALGEQLLGHAVLRNLVQLLESRPVTLAELTSSVARSSRELRTNPELASHVVASFLSLISRARSWLPEREHARTRREERGRPRPTRPLLEVRVQLWQRELRRMVADVGPEPNLRYSDDLTDEQRTRHLPVIYCRDCGAMGWATCVARDRPDLFAVGLERFYRAFFADDPQVRFLWPAGAQHVDPNEFERIVVNPATLARIRDEGETETGFDLVLSANTRTVSGRQELQRNCPFCGARESLALLGFRASTLTSVYIDQLFASDFNDDKKLLAFSDSVQDAAHRAGFFGARTWTFNLRVALRKVVANTEGVSLAELPGAFFRAWRQASTGGAPAPGIQPLDDAEFVATFLAPNMEWFQDYEALLRDESIRSGSRLVTDVERRIEYEIGNEYGLQARIGRSLPRTGSSTVAVDPKLLDTAADILLERLRNEIGGLRTLSRSTLRLFLLGSLHHLREVGGIDHPQLPRSFIETAGQDDYAFKLNVHLPSFGPRSRFGALLTTDPRSRRFDRIFESSASGWYGRWTMRVLGPTATVIGEPREIWAVVLPVLVSVGILKQTDGVRGKVWGLAPEALRVTNECRRLRCPRCRHWMVVAASEAADLMAACLNPPCTGGYEADVIASKNYFGRLIERGEVRRVFAREHTGLLDRAEREELEREFKAEERKPWYPNLLSCTPTLEMGIDIGSLSSAVLCSVPPAQANYLQRIGRAGRRDGNSFVLTIAQARPHDLFFYAQPNEMIAGDVQPPGVFLNASAVLERQLTAYSLDQWTAAPGSHKLAARLREVFSNLESSSEEAFPHNWLAFVRREQVLLLRNFVALFNPEDPTQPRVLSESSETHLREFLLGNEGNEGSLSWKVLDALQRERKAAESLRKKARRLKDLVKELKEATARDKDHEKKIVEHEREQAAYERLTRALESTLTLEFLTNEGLLPNYAFPEAPVRLRSIIWKRKKQADGVTDAGYETHAYEYARPPVSALSELAPEAQFYAGGRRVSIDQVDVDTVEIETWRFCNSCSYCTPVDHEDTATDCPSCGSAEWGEESQRRHLLRLQQVFARTSDRKSRIRDDKDEREPRFFNRHMLPTFRDEDRQGAWKLDSKLVPFAFEYLRRARFREVNFGERNDDGTKFSIAGRTEARPGFVICRRCGKVQSARTAAQTATTPANDPGEHTLWCPVRQRGAKPADYEAAVYLYREFSSEAVRLLLPLADMSSERRLHSFVAAFQLGVKDRYGGRVDHLQTLVYSEPDQEETSLLRRQYLVLYDGVPGGTGYLKDLMRDPPEGEEHALLDVLRRARDRISSCECSGDPSRDGCYRCLFAYRNSRDMSDTSAREALGLLTDILDQAATLTKTSSLSDISVAGLMDSVLEARFVEALQRLSRPDRPVAVQKRLVRNQPGFGVTVGSQEWLIEPQVEVGSAQGLPVGVSIDFVLRPASAGSQRTPIAVFLDGFQYHRDRIGFDMLQRMSLQTSGTHDVWSFTWQDIDAAFDKTSPLPPMLLHPDGAVLKRWYQKLGHGAWTKLLDSSPLEILLTSLASADDPIPWAQLGAVALIAQMSLPAKSDLEVWRSDVISRLPNAFQPAYQALDHDGLFTRRVPEASSDLSLWATATRAAAQDLKLLDAFRAVVWFDDSPEFFEDPAFRETWRGYLFMFLFLRALPQVLFLTKSGRRLAEFAGLAQMRAAKPLSVTPGWEAALDVGAGFESIVRGLAEAGVQRPEVGLDLPDGRGLSSGVEGELVWEKSRVAVVRDIDDPSRRRIASDWTIFVLADIASDISPLVREIQRGAQGDGP